MPTVMTTPTIGEVDVLLLVWLHLTTLDIVVVTADAVETRVARVLQLIEQGGADEGWKSLFRGQ